MKPTELIILGLKHTIEYVDRPSDVDIHKRESLWGQVDPWTRTIRIYDNGTSIDNVWHTIIHEVLHVIADELKLEALTKEEYHDDLDTLALALVDTFVRNDLMKL